MLETKYNEDIKKEKSKGLVNRKPFVADINLDKITNDLWDIQEACEEIRYYTDSDDGEDSLINALEGDECEAWEFKMAFSDLCADCERMMSDLNDRWIPECFDTFFVAIGAGSQSGLMCFDPVAQDYYGIDTDFIEEGIAKRKLMKMKKEELIEAAKQCFRIYNAYVGLTKRFDSLKTAIDILRNKNIGVLQMVREINEMYEKSDFSGSSESMTEFTRKWDRYVNSIPDELWLN